MTESEDGYLDLVRRHPRPSDDQIAAFARFVATDHSWYKHLPRTGRGEPFFFYLDPHVHELLLDVVDGSGVWRPIIRELGRFPFPTFAVGYEAGDVADDSIAPMDHVARRATTAEWRERYGIFNYWNHGPPDQPPAEAVEAADRGLRYADDNGLQRRVPPPTHSSADSSICERRSFPAIWATELCISVASRIRIPRPFVTASDSSPRWPRNCLASWHGRTTSPQL